MSAADTPEPLPREGTGDDATGYTVAPVRYSAHGRETIDRIRDELGDDGFVAYCRGAAMKHEDRAGLKGDAEEDRKKARWYPGDGGPRLGRHARPASVPGGARALPPAPPMTHLVTLPDGTVTTPARAPRKTPRVHPFGGMATHGTPIRMTCACGSAAVTLTAMGERWPLRDHPARCRSAACREARHTPEWAPPAPGRYVLRSSTCADLRTRAQLEEGITVVSATVDMDRYAVVGTIRHGEQELAAAWDDGEWRRIAGWLRRG